MHRNEKIQMNLYYTNIIEVNLSVFAYRLLHEDFSPIIGTNFKYKICSNDWREISTKQSVNNTGKLTSVIFAHKALH